MVQGKYGSVSYKSKINKPRAKDQWYVVENTHEPIIDRELWDSVQSMVKERAKPFITGQIGLFARKVRCMNCGYVMRSVKSHGYYYLKCSSRHIANDACIGSFISVDKLEKAVLLELRRLSDEYLDQDELERNVKFNDALQEEKIRVEADITFYQRRIAEYAKGIRELYLDKVKGLLSESDFIEFTKNFTIEKARLEQLATDCQEHLEILEKRMESGDNRRQIIEQYTSIERLDRVIVEELIDYITVGKRAYRTQEIPIEIHWNF
jgi:hypothetical protein